MRILAVKSVPLSEDTVASWKSTEDAGHTFRFLKRERNPNDAVPVAETNAYDMVLNLGNSELVDLDAIVWNNVEVCDVLRTPGGMRKSPLSGLLPPQAGWNDPNVWVKGPGRGGWNKHHYTTGLADEAHLITNEWDCQKHVDGQEWRILTVGYRVVQSSRRHGPNENRRYEWVGTGDTPKPVKNICRYAASLLPNLRTVIAWDVIINDVFAVILEGNTCPGVNAETATRVVDELKRQVVDGDARTKPLTATNDFIQFRNEYFGNYMINTGTGVIFHQDDVTTGNNPT